MVVPVGDAYQQTLYLMRKKDGHLQAEKLQPTLFVPMTGRADQERQAQDARGAPAVLNGNFEQPPGDNGYLPGWYYQRLVTWETGREAPEGEHFIRLRNQTPGRMAHIMQGFAADGRRVAAVTVSAWAQYSDTRPGRMRTEVPAALVSFYDADRKEVGMSFLGVFLGSGAWQRHTKEIRVPPESRQAIIRLGLFGSTGEVAFDDIRLEPVLRP
jgi:protein-L-isoaspartate(D-aspartate) O-methyltransferase